MQTEQTIFHNISSSEADQFVLRCAYKNYTQAKNVSNESVYFFFFFLVYIRGCIHVRNVTCIISKFFLVFFTATWQTPLIRNI